MRVLAVADSDSYLKWSVATLGAMPAAWSRSQVLVRSPVTPSAAQVQAAAGRDVTVLGLPGLVARVRRERPDVVLLACTGPTVEVLTGLPGLGRGARRPVLVTGLPGLHVDPTVRALRHRSRCDLFLAHSHAEVEALTGLRSAYAPGLDIGLARLPFLSAPAVTIAAGTRSDYPGESPPPGDVVFAAQAQVPERRADREAVLRALAALPPAGSAVVKVRAGPRESQTHHERWPYPLLWHDLVRRGVVESGAVRFAAGSMADALVSARALVTVSSTAALEAVARGLPLAVLTDFGVSPGLLNSVFAHSGCLASLADVRAGRFRRPGAAWRHRHYFHPAAHDDWLARIDGLLAEREAGGLPARPSQRTGSRLGSWRRRARLLLPAPLGRALARTRGETRRLDPHRTQASGP